MQIPNRGLSGLFVFCLIPILGGCSSVGESSGGTNERVTIEWQEGHRVFDYYVPEGIAATEEAPLFVVFHGAGDNGASFQRNAGLDPLAERHGFVVAYPTASGANWAEGCNCIRPDLDGVDDVGFADEVVAYMDEHFEINLDRVFAVGYSQGAIFTHRLMCERSEVFAGFASVSGMMNEPVAGWCNPAHPVDVLMMHGRKDTVLPFAGISGAQGTLSVPETAEKWSQFNGCQSMLPPHTVDGEQTSWIITDYVTCEDGVRVRMAEGSDLGHTWSHGPTGAPESIVRFLLLGE